MRLAAQNIIKRLFPITNEAANVEPLGGDFSTGLADPPCLDRIIEQHSHRLDELRGIRVDESADAVFDHSHQLGRRQSNDRQPNEHRFDEGEAKAREANWMEI